MSRFLVKYRKLLFLLMTALTIACALAVPRIHVNTDMTRYLPDSYPMKQGLDVMEAELPALKDQMQEFGALFADGNDLMPTNLPRTLAIGVGLLFGVLLVMCSSVMEVVLFLLATVYAVILNMGTNALLPSVSMMTNMLAPVLQMVLSMDYCIILMNRYRQEKALGKAPEAAMQGAIGGGASSILSSAFTTIVSLMMLCFIKLKIGADLGIVLSKGVSFSLICNFTVLPFLILAADKAVEATRKKVPVFPAEGVSRFAYRFRYPLTVLFVAVFAGFTYLQRQTPLTFSPQWDSPALEEASSENAALLIYPNRQEKAIPALMDSLVALPGAHQGISYPSLVKRPRTAEEMSALFSEFAPSETSAFPADMLSLVYYARFHPKRTERLSFRELMDLTEELSREGLIPEEFDYPLDMDALLAPTPEPEPILPPEESLPVPMPTDTLSEAPAIPANPQPADSVDVEEPAPVAPKPAGRYSYEEVTREYTAAEMARFLDFDQRQVSMLYRLAGRRNQTMTPSELLSFVQQKILPDKHYAAFIPKGMDGQIADFQAQIDSALAAGPTPVPVPVPILADSLLPAETISIAEVTDIQADTTALAIVPEPEPVEAPAPPPTPIEVLADMAFSSVRYSSARIHSALSSAGIAVPREQLDLLFLYSGARKGADPAWKMSPEELLNFVADTLLVDPALSAFVPDSTRTLVAEAREELLSGVGKLRGENYSGAVILSGYPPESDSTFVFVDRLRALSDASLEGPHYWIGESEMYKELKEGFPQELMLLTLLTVLSIFLIVALTFRSVFIPIPLVMTILSGVYVNIWASGLGGNTLYYLSYLIIQGILMGATIDYTILFTHYYLSARGAQQQEAARVRGACPPPDKYRGRGPLETSSRLSEDAGNSGRGRSEAESPRTLAASCGGVADALSAAYRGSSHSILTSGLILTVVPWVMSLVMTDAMISSILRSLSIGSFAILILTLFVLPGAIAALDPLMKRRISKHPQKTHTP